MRASYQDTNMKEQSTAGIFVYLKKKKTTTEIFSIYKAVMYMIFPAGNKV